MPSRLRVPLGYVSALLVFAFAHPTRWSIAAGFLVAVPGEILRLWASGHIEKTRALATGGPYAHTRNPLYLGSTVMVLGASISAWTVPSALVLALYLVACYPAVIREEGAFLARTFPEYDAWAREVPPFLPRLTPGGPRSSSFDWARVRKNQEWKAALAVPGMVVLFCLRRLIY